MLTQLRLLWKLKGAWEHAREEAGKMDAKPIWKSKTFYFNLLMGGLQIADWAAGSGLLPVQYAAGITMVGNILLRLVTGQPIAMGKPA
jgi:hypothetical protein